MRFESRIVVGFMPEVDDLPKGPRSEGPLKRFSVSLMPIDREGESHFDAARFLEVLRASLGALAWETLRARFSGSADWTLTSLPELETRLGPPGPSHSFLTRLKMFLSIS
jgi:hypothetical protein